MYELLAVAASTSGPVAGTASDGVTRDGGTPKVGKSDVGDLTRWLYVS